MSAPTILLEIAERRRRRLAESGPEFGAALPPERELPIVPFPGPTGLICEIKRRSPSRGAIGEIPDPVEQARRYRQGGAGAVSVLTEMDYFAGSLEDLMAVKWAEPELAVLRKDFLLGPEEVEISHRSGADAILLIAALLEVETVGAMLREAERLGLAALVEVHTREEARAVAPLAPPLVGMNSRDLHSFTVDRTVPLEVASAIDWPAELVFESGIARGEDVRLALAAGFSAVLVGETAVRHPERLPELAAAARGRGDAGAGRETDAVERGTDAGGRAAPGPGRGDTAAGRGDASAGRGTAAPGRRTAAPARERGEAAQEHGTDAAARGTNAATRGDTAAARGDTAPGRRTAAPARERGEAARERGDAAAAGFFWRRLYAGAARPLVKICGITNRPDAEVAVAAGATALGFIFAPSPRRVGIDLLQDLADLHVLKVAVVVAGEGKPGVPPELAEALAEGLIQAVQLHGNEMPEECARLAFPYYKALRVQEPRDLDAAEAYRSPRVLLDAFDREAYGGTGKRIRRELVEAARERGPIWLAGGLNPENVGQIVREFRPELVDVSSGVEAEPGRKDHAALRRFVAAAREAAEQVKEKTDG